MATSKKKLMDFEEVMRRASAMMVTTFELRNYALEFNQSVAVIPNAIKPSLFPQVRADKSNEIRMLWAGGSSHYADLAEVSDALTELMNVYPQLNFYFIGVPFEGIAKRMPQDRVHKFPWIEPHGHGYRLACMDADIGLCPLQDTVFNRAKSSVKYYEYSAVRMATVARNIPPYSDDIRHDYSGMLYDTPSELYKQVSELIDNPVKRLQIAENAYKYVTKERHIDEITRDWVSYLEGVSNAYR
jgi:glycosyltransferase involved in cell wall biosynthesis